MAIKEHRLWDLFDRVWKKYAEPTAKLCCDFASGAISYDAFGVQLATISRDPKIDKSKQAYCCLGKAFVERTHPELMMNLLRDNLLIRQRILRTNSLQSYGR